MGKQIEEDEYTIKQQLADQADLIRDLAESNVYLTKQNLQHMKDIDKLKAEFSQMVLFQSQLLDAIKEHFGRDIKNTLRVVK